MMSSDFESIHRIRYGNANNVVLDDEDNNKNGSSIQIRSAPGSLDFMEFGDDSGGGGNDNDDNDDYEDGTTTYKNSYSPSFERCVESCASDSKKALDMRRTGKPMGHCRHTKGGFASGPPWPTSKRENAWTKVSAWQIHQQIQAIEREIGALTSQTLVGIGKWRPKWLQSFGSKTWMLFWLCWFCLVQGLLVNGLIPSAITSIERRFQFSSSVIGLIMQFYDFGYVLFCIPVSYFGGRHSKPMVLAFGLVLLALGSFIFSLPYSISDTYSSIHPTNEKGYSRCGVNRPSQEILDIVTLEGNRSVSLSISIANSQAIKSCPAPEDQAGTFRYVFLFSLAHFLHGVGATPLFTLGVSYIDENVGQALSSLYLGVFCAFSVFGPAFGFLMSSSFLRYHTDFLQSSDILNIDESHQNWVGAWWIGFRIACFLALIAVFPILILPKVLPESLKWHRIRLHEEAMRSSKKRNRECCGLASLPKPSAVSGPLLVDDEGQQKLSPVVIGESMPALRNRGPFWFHIWLDIRHIPIAIYRTLSNGAFMLITLGMAVDGLIVTGASAFMSKYLERQFNVAPSKANMLIGCIMVPMAGIGTMFSGFMIQRFRLSCNRTLKLCIALLLCSLVLSPMYLIYCEHDSLAGIESHYEVDLSATSHIRANETTQSSPLLYSTCNQHCDCVDHEYHPLCAEFIDGTQMAFYSPCYAGCEERYDVLKKFYVNCSCVPSRTKFGYRAVKNGYCESKCSGLLGFLIMFAPFCFFTFGAGVPLISVVLRSVDYAERSFALGIQWILMRIIGSIPAPVVFGWMFDVSCIRYNLDGCSGSEGSCLLYHNKSLAELFLIFSVIGQTISLGFLVCAVMFFSAHMRDGPLPGTATIKMHGEIGANAEVIKGSLRRINEEIQ